MSQPLADGRSARGDEAIAAGAPVFVISVAAQLAGMHAQTLRSYDRDGLVTPSRAAGGGRRYSYRDIELLREVQRLSQDEGVNRAGIRRIMQLEAQVDALRARLTEVQRERASLLDELSAVRAEAHAQAQRHNIAARAAADAVAALRRDLVPLRATGTDLVRWTRG